MNRTAQGRPSPEQVERALSALTGRTAGIEELTESDRVVLAFLVGIMRRFSIHGTGATARFVAEQTGLTRYAVRHALRRLEETGVLDVEPGRGPIPAIVTIPGLVKP